MTTHKTGHDAASSEGTVTATETGSGTYTQQITAGHHRLVADEPRPIRHGLTWCTSCSIRSCSAIPTICCRSR